MSRRSSLKIDESRLPDGGWGWMVVLGVALTNMFNQALVSVFGLLFGERLEEMGHGTAGISLVSNVNNMVLCFSGLAIGPILKRYSIRSVSVFGSLLTTTGLVLCSYANTIGELLVYYSFLTGIGLGLIYPVTFVVIKDYFVKKRGQAVGISMAGTGIGQMLMPQFVRILLDEYGFDWTIRIVGALCLHGAVGSMLFHPVKWHLKPDPLVTKKLLNNNEISIKIDNDKKPKLNVVQNVESSTEKVQIEKHETIPLQAETSKDATEDSGLILQIPKPWYKRLASSLQLQLLLEPSFANLCLGIALVYTSSVAFGMIFPFLLLEGPNLKLSRADTALCMSLLSAADIVARLTIPTFTDCAGLSSRASFMWGALLLAIARTVVTMQDTLGMMIAASLLTGYIRAITVINQNLTVSEHCTKNGIDEQLPSALGLMMVSKGMFVISFGQLLGWLRDVTSSYTLFVYGTNILLVIVFISWFSEYFFKKLRKSEST